MTGTGTGTGTIGNNGSLFLSMSWTSVNISTWYTTFHLMPVSVPFPCSVNIPFKAGVGILLCLRSIHAVRKEM